MLEQKCPVTQTATVNFTFMGLIFSVVVIALIFMVIEGFERFQRYSCLP